MPSINEMYDEANTLKEQGDMEGAVAKLEEILTIDENHCLSHSALAVYAVPANATTTATRIGNAEPTRSSVTGGDRYMTLTIRR